jgi:hypothetical protein
MLFGKLPRMTAEFPTEKFYLVLARSFAFGKNLGRSLQISFSALASLM